MGYEIVNGPVSNVSDVSEFIETLGGLDVHPDPRLHNFFDKQSDLTVTRAPGRLDVMGGIADYSGSLVLELPIAEATYVALQKDDSRRLLIASLLEGRVVTFEMPLDDLEVDSQPLSYSDAEKYFRTDPRKHWAAYVAGVFLVLMRDRGTRFTRGARLLISSKVPDGKGVSSSAALEVATMSAVAAAFDLEIPGRDLGMLCQRVENLVAGAASGVMDQMTSACGEENQLLALVCQPAEVLGTIKLPQELSVWGLDSGVRHSVGGGDYGSVRVGTFMGYRIIAELTGLRVTQTGDFVTVDDPRWGGYLANLTPSEFQDRFANNLPATIGGAEFLARYGRTTDTVTQVNPNRTYQVRAPAAHAVFENSRVHRFADLLRRAEPLAKEEKVALGELMFESHASYSACGLGSQGTDDLVELVRTAGLDQGLYGAKITGGGSGGTVAVLGDAAAFPAVLKIARRFSEMSGQLQTYIFSGSSPGSTSFGHLVLRRGDE